MSCPHTSTNTPFPSVNDLLEPLEGSKKTKTTLLYDTSEGEVFNVDFEVTNSYKLDRIIGCGSYGIVASGTHRRTGIRVAIKRIPLFEYDALVCMRALREIKLLCELQHENLVETFDIQFASSEEDLTHVYIIQRLMPTDLARVVRGIQLTNEHVRYITYQLLCGVHAIHSRSIIHRDLKPSNILIDTKCNVQICDFGLARLISPHSANLENNEGRFMTEYVATRWYRAPEIYLFRDNYGPAMDMWSVGCIMAEMMGNKPLFPGKNHVDQMNKFVELLGAPDEKRLSGLPLICRNFFDGCVMTRVDFEKRFPHIEPLGIDLMNRLLQILPEDRISCEEALAHPYMSTLHDTLPEACPLQDDFFQFEAGTSRMKFDELRKVAFDELNKMSKVYGFNRN